MESEVVLALSGDIWQGLAAGKQIHTISVGRTIEEFGPHSDQMRPLQLEFGYAIRRMVLSLGDLIKWQMHVPPGRIVPPTVVPASYQQGIIGSR